MKTKKPKIKTKGKSYPLQECIFYKLTSKKRLEKILFTSIAELELLSNDINYVLFYEKSDVNKKRLIEKPNEKLDIIHTRIASLISRIVQPQYMHSGLKDKSYISNARAHLGTNPTLTTDIKSFFPSTTRQKVFNFFYKKLRCSSDIADLLSRLCTINNHIPTGSRISMPLAYWANIDMFNNLYAISCANDIEMTVYVDDVTFSGKKVNRQFLSRVKKIITSESHIMHPTKTILYDGMEIKKITGVIIANNKLKVPNSLHNKIHFDMEAWKLPNNNNDTSIKDRLLGRVYAAANIDSRFKDKARTIKK
ncbi:reverse transcriptase [Hafnia paralvei ATCC 29927]|uniref:reverse transcriptase family protein n=1 Tax=Hafnia paralvei TaxID=546367 RepID=UPI0007E4A01B|nr:reverse transcriptase family protein [Hafnia paralvei]OAT41093.1 reverse transcriptase [Hafnia paralvei ATCC 29927]